MTSYKIRCEMPFCGARGEQTEFSKNTKIVAFALGIILTSLGVATLLAPHIFTIGATAGYVCIAVGAVALLESLYLRSLPLSSSVQKEIPLVGGGARAEHEEPSNATKRLQSLLQTWLENPEAQGAKEEAARRITQAFQNNEIHLSLDHLGLTQLPPCLLALAHLQSLSLQGNYFVAMPDFTKLPKLNTLNLDWNERLKQIPQTIRTHFTREGHTLTYTHTQVKEEQKDDGVKPAATATVAAGGALGVKVEEDARAKFVAELEAWKQDPDVTGKKDEAARTIQEVYDTKAKKLDLGTLHLSKIPDCICQLSWVTNLRLMGNPIVSLPEELDRLPLFYLNLEYTRKLTKLPQRLIEKWKREGSPLGLTYGASGLTAGYLQSVVPKR